MKLQLYKVYYVKNKDLGFEDSVPGHEIILVKRSKNKSRVKVKTITSIEGNHKPGQKRRLKNSNKDIIELVYEGEIIVIPKKDLNTPKLSGVFKKGIWIESNKLMESKYDTRISKRYIKIIGK